MSRSLARIGLCALVFLTLADVKRRSLHSRSARVAHKEALQVWEDEGGALP
jgi:hypothetical protein